MVCMKCCSVAIIFIVAKIYMCVLAPLILDENKMTVMKQLKETLTLEQQNTLDRIKKERLSIHLRGYGIGLLLSSFFLYVKYFTRASSLTPNIMVCTTAAITFTANYFYYILSPKSDWMVIHLNTQGQKQAWLKMYRHMQFQYHVGFLFGILAVIFMTKGVCR